MAEDIKINLDLKKRSEDFHKDYKIISEKHKIDIAAILYYSKDGIFPKLAIIDLAKKKKNG
jgi:hypothetical protein